MQIRGHKIRDAREKVGLTLKELSQKLEEYSNRVGSKKLRGVSVMQLSKIERGKASPTRTLVNALCDVLNVGEEDFKQLPRRIRIGFSRFPDTIIMRYTRAGWESFGSDDLDFIPLIWEEGLEKVANAAVHFAICNSEDFDNHSQRNLIKYLGDCSTYRGYALLALNPNVKPYLTVLTECLKDSQQSAKATSDTEKAFRRQVLKKTLEPLNNENTFCYVDAEDMKRFVEDVFSVFGKDNTKIQIIKKLRPGEGFEKFFEQINCTKSNPTNLYVGGLTHRMVAEGKGAFPVVSAQEASDALDKDLRSANGLVVNADFFEDNKDIVEIWIDIWNDLVSQLYVDSGKIIQEVAPHIRDDPKNREFTDFHYHRVFRNGLLEFHQLSKRVLQGDQAIRIKRT